MKKVIYIVVFAIVVLLGGCAKADSTKTETQPVKADSTKTETQPATVTLTGTQENWNKYEVTDEHPEFSTAINSNPIDAAYLREKNFATTAGDFVELEKKYISFWQQEMNISTERFLAVLTDEDAELFMENQKNWVQAIDADLQITNDILHGSNYALPLGLTFSQLLLSEKRELYRERTIKIKYLHYLIESSMGLNDNALQSTLFSFEK